MSKNRGQRRERRSATTFSTVDRERHRDCSPEGIATNLLLQHGDRLLVVRNRQQSLSDLYVVDDTGIWRRGDDQLKKWMFQRADNLRTEAVSQGASEREVLATLRAIRPLQDPGSLQKVREAASAAFLVLQESRRGINIDDGSDLGVTVTLDTDLDRDMRYIGTASGVVDLHTCELLPPGEGRRKLVTESLDATFDPTATHPDVDALFAHLPSDERVWWWEVLGYALRGSPSARIYEVIGPPNGGKSGLVAALAATLGPYAGVPQPGLLEYRRGAVESETGLSPSTVAMVPPRRFALFDEVKPHRLNNKLMKDWSGDGAGVTWQPKYKEPRTDPVTATMFLFCNTGQEARLGMQDAGMRRRLRTLRYPAIPLDDMIENFNMERIYDPEFQTALLARLVKAARAGRTGSPPEAPPSVMAATEERIIEDVGEIGVFAKYIARGGVLTIPELWSAWCKHNDEPEESPEPGGISRRRLSTELRHYVAGMPAPKQVRKAGETARGWRGWQLLDKVPASDQPIDVRPDYDQLIDDAEYKLPDGTMITGAELLVELRRRGAGWRLACWSSPVLVDGVPREVTHEQSAELHQHAYDVARIEGLDFPAFPKPAPGAKRLAMLERTSMQGSEPPPDTATQPLFPDVDAQLEGTEATKSGPTA